MMNVAVLFGGLSSEYEISCLSAASVLRHIRRQAYHIYPVGITKEGKWFLYENAEPDKIEDCSWVREPSLVPALLSPDRGIHGLYLLRGGGERLRLDCVFPALHGFGGEDGTIQGLCALAGIPCVGPGVAASAIAMDKSLTKVLAARAGVRQAAYFLARAAAFEQDPEGVTAQAMERIGRFPVFVKPCSSGSSVGVTRAGSAEELRRGLQEGFRWDEKVLVEEYIDGHEIEVAVLGNRDPVASLAGEIAPTQAFYSYDAKYHDATSELYIPAQIPEDAMQTARESAVRVYQALGCRGLSRVDFFCTWQGNEIVFNEINTIPGFTSISMYPKLFAHAGIPFAELIDRLVALAVEEGTNG